MIVAGVGAVTLLGKQLTVKEVSELTNMSETFIRRLIRERRIAHHKFGRQVRINEHDLAAWIEANRHDSLR